MITSRSPRRCQGWWERPSRRSRSGRRPVPKGRPDTRRSAGVPHSDGDREGSGYQRWRRRRCFTDHWTKREVPPLRPPEVTVIVVDPGLSPVANPVASIVATVVSLLVHVAPIPTTVTGVKASPSGLLRSRPAPSQPKSPRPQHLT